MSSKTHPLAGLPAPQSLLVDVSKLLAAYVNLRPAPENPAQRVAFGTSGHRGSAFKGSFNEWHVLAICQAICDYRKCTSIDGPLYIGFDTHALSLPAFESALTVLAANGVETMIAAGGEFTPTPAISHAILTYNRGRSAGLADGIVITPSHNPPADGGIKYNPPNGGPANSDVTGWIQGRANALLVDGLRQVHRLSLASARHAATTHAYDFLGTYTDDLGAAIDFEAIRGAGIRMAVDPLGGAGVHYWAAIAQRYGLDLKVLSEVVDPTFAFMSVDWDGQIRMDPSSPFAMQRLLAAAQEFDVAFACDPDHDRHGIVTRSGGLLASNHYLTVMIDYLFQQRPFWSKSAAIGKTLVSTGLIDRLADRLQRRVFEVPVGFKWFVDGLSTGELGFAGEESAGATFLRRDGTVWTTDKDGIVAALLAAEITAHGGSDPALQYQELSNELGEPFADRRDAPATPEQKARLTKLSALQVPSRELAGEPIISALDSAPGNQAAIGGIKVTTANGWFAARPSGTEDIYKIYAESFKDHAHLQLLLREAQNIVDAALAQP